MARRATKQRRTETIPRAEIESLTSAFEVYRPFPVEFCRDIIGVELDEWQRWGANAVARPIRALYGLADPSEDMRHTAIASSTGVGKDMLAACLGLWFLNCFKNPKIIVTGPNDDQLDDVIWPEFAKWINHSPILPQFVEWQAEKIVHLGNPTNAFISKRTARVRITEGERHAEGLSGVHEENVFIIFDEAPGIEEEVFDALLPTMTEYNNIALAIGNPNRTIGRFFRIFFDSEEMQGWQRARVSSEAWPKHPALRGRPDFVSSRPTDEIKADFRRMPIGHPVRLSKMYGMHPVAATDNTVYSFDEVLEAFTRPLWPFDPEDSVQIGIDVARFGKDRTVYWVRRGWNVTDLVVQEWSDTGTIKNTTRDLVEREASISYWLRRGGDYEERRAEFAALDQFQRARFHPKVVLDLGGGYGAGAYDDLIAEGYTCIDGINFGESAWNDEKYVDLASEMWCETLKEIMPVLSFKAIASDPEKKRALERLRVQLTSRPYDTDATDQRIKIMSKKKMREKGMPSPDEADGLCCCVVTPAGVGAA